MPNRSSQRGIRGISATEELETRAVPSAGLSGLSNIVQELGTVSRSAATAGVEATAWIRPESSVTFRFDLQAAGDYTLLVRHVGNGLTLDAQTPSGSASINPGPAGPFRVVPLHLDSATYEVKATAQTGQPVYVDWELLLNSGVSQAAVTAAPAILPVPAVPSPSTAATGTGASGPSTPASSASACAAGASSPPAPAPPSSGQAESTPTYLASGPVGRPPLDPAAPPVIALAPEQIATAYTPSLVDLEAALMVVMQPAAPGQAEINAGSVGASEAPIDAPWYDTLVANARGQSPPATPEEPASADHGISQLGAETRSTPASPDRVSLASISPGLLLGGVAVTVAARSRIKRNAQWTGLVAPGRMPISAPEPTLQRLREIFARSYRPGRCQPVRPMGRPDQPAKRHIA